MKTLGILGGVGPDTTAKIYLSIIDLVRKNKKDYYPSISIYNLPWPFILEKEMLIQGKNSEKMIPYLVEGAKNLEKAGASFGILPCNTLHKYLREIRESVKIPFLSILDETALKIKSLKIKKVGILSTQITIDSKMYEHVLTESKIKLVYPNTTEQKIVNEIIFDLVRGKSGSNYSGKIEKICISLGKRGAQSILLACTDLQLAIQNINTNISIIDSTQVLAEASVRELIKV